MDTTGLSGALSSAPGSCCSCGCARQRPALRAGLLLIPSVYLTGGDRKARPRLRPALLESPVMDSAADVRASSSMESSWCPRMPLPPTWRAHRRLSLSGKQPKRDADETCGDGDLKEGGADATGEMDEAASANGALRPSALNTGAPGSCSLRGLAPGVPYLAVPPSLPSRRCDADDMERNCAEPTPRTLGSTKKLSWGASGVLSVPEDPPSLN